MDNAKVCILGCRPVEQTVIFLSLPVTFIIISCKKQVMPVCLLPLEASGRQKEKIEAERLQEGESP